MSYVLANVAVPHQEKSYSAGPVRRSAGRMAHKVSHSLEHATKFGTREEAEAMRKELGDGFRVVVVERKA